jgi:hypothetical protein
MLRKISKRATRAVRKNNPTRSQVHVNTPLTMLSVAYQQDETNFVGYRAFAVIPVQHASDLYYKFSKDAFLRDEAKPRAPATESAGGGFSLTTDSYACSPIAFHKDVADQDRDNADSVLQLDTVATQYVTSVMNLRREKQWVSQYFTTGVWAVESTPSLLWDDPDSTPKKDFNDAQTTLIKNSGGRKGNVFVISPYVYNALMIHPELKDQFKYTSANSIDLAMIARYFGIDEVLVAYGIQATNVEGQAVTTDFIAGKHALLAYRNPNPALMMPSAGYVMSWNQYAGSQAGATISKFRMQQLRADRIEGEFAYDMKVVCADCGFFFANLVS